MAPGSPVVLYPKRLSSGGLPNSPISSPCLLDLRLSDPTSSNRSAERQQSPWTPDLRIPQRVKICFACPTYGGEGLRSRGIAIRERERDRVALS